MAVGAGVGRGVAVGAGVSATAGVGVRVASAAGTTDGWRDVAWQAASSEASRISRSARGIIGRSLSGRDLREAIRPPLRSISSGAELRAARGQLCKRPIHFIARRCLPAAYQPITAALYRVRHGGTATAPLLRRGTAADIRPCHDLLWTSATDLGRRHGTELEGSPDDWWTGMQPVNAFLAEHAAEWWVAEAPDTDEPIGYARSIERGGLFELTELFVRPGRQSKGIGRQLLEHAFPVGRGEVRSIIATTDVRATARYYAADTVARFPYFTLGGRPRPDADRSGISVEAIETDELALAAVTRIERDVLDFPRGTDELRWLAATRPGHLFLRRGEPIGFAFIGKSAAGPIAALEPRDLPAILGHVEGLAVAAGADRLEMEVPGVNEAAIRHLLGRGFHIDPWINLLMSNRPFGRFDRFIGFSPPIFL